MEKIKWDFRDELMQYKAFFWLYIVEVYDPLTDMKDYWIMKENQVVERGLTENMAFAKLWEHIEYLDQQNELLIDEELERRAEEKGEDYEPEYYGDEDID